MRVEVSSASGLGEDRIVYFGPYAQPTWLDDSTLSVGRRRLDVRTESYDERTADGWSFALAWGLVIVAGVAAGGVGFGIAAMLSPRRPRKHEPIEATLGPDDT